MEPSAKEIRHEELEPLNPAVDPPQAEFDAQVDQYAQAELEHRNERMERIIRKAQQLT